MISLKIKSMSIIEILVIILNKNIELKFKTTKMREIIIKFVFFSRQLMNF